MLRGDRLGIIGPNGAGKTTLLNLLTARAAPDSGDVKVGSNVELATLDQARASLKPDTTLADALTGGGSDQVIVNGASKHVIGYMKDFLFGPEQARTPLSRLSGGERGRLMLARALSLPSNLLVLDEPTNDLDLETLDLLQDMLADYPGTVVVVSHDRDFLDRVATSVVNAEGQGRWTEYAGGYSDMVAQRGIGVTAPSRDMGPGSTGGTGSPATAAPAFGFPRAPVPSSNASRRKMSFKEKHALDTLPRIMDEMRSSRRKLQAALEDPGLYARDPAKFAKLTAALGDTESKLAVSEEEWLTLEMMREEMEG